MNQTIYTVLIIDDKEAVYESIKNKANDHHIILKWCDNLIDGAKMLQNKDIHFEGVILDAKGYNSPKSIEESELFMSSAIQNEEIKNLPHVFYTGNKNLVDNYISEMNFNIKVFEKGEDEEKMFIQLRELIENRAEYKIEIDYSEYFIIFDDYYLERSLKKHLIRIINNVKNGVDVLNEIRTFIDKIYLKLKDHGICDQRLYRNTNDPISGWFPLYLSNKNVKKDNQIYIPKTGKNWLKNEVISNSLWLLKNLCNNSSHNFYKDNNSFTANTYNIMHLSINSIFLLVDWVKAVVDNKEKADNEIDNWLLKSTKA